MRRERVLRCRIPELEIELHPSAFLPALAETQQAATDEDRCACTHSLSAQHGDLGCLEGCDTELCARTDAERHPRAQA